MGYAGAVCLGAVLATSAALAEEPAPYPCEKVANETAQRLGTSVNQKGQNEGEYSYADVNGAKVRFACPSGRQRFPRLSLSWAAAYPPKAFWDTVSSAGTVLTIASARRVKLAAHECHKAAALAEGKPAAVRQIGLGIECQVTSGKAPLTVITLRRRSNRRASWLR